MIGDRLAKFVVASVVCVWAMTTVVLPLAVKGYSPPPEIGTVMGIVAGGAVAVIFAKRGDKKNGEDKDEPPADNGRTVLERAVERGRQRKEARE